MVYLIIAGIILCICGLLFAFLNSPYYQYLKYRSESCLNSPPGTIIEAGEMPRVSFEVFEVLYNDNPSVWTIMRWRNGFDILLTPYCNINDGPRYYIYFKTLRDFHKYYNFAKTVRKIRIKELYTHARETTMNNILVITTPKEGDSDE